MIGGFLKIYTHTFPWQMGFLKIQTTDDEIISIYFLTQKAYFEKMDLDELLAPFLSEAKKQILEYLAGERTEFDLKIKLQGSPFSLKVWHCLKQIPFGTTVGYGEIARALGGTAYSRAVGRACGLNPIPIVIPCHRVIGAEGKLGGFSGGLGIKSYLLKHEKSHLSEVLVGESQGLAFSRLPSSEI